MTTHRVARIVLGLSMGLSALGGIGCRNQPPAPVTQSFSELPAGSFAQAWQAEVEADSAFRSLQVIGDRVYATTDRNQFFSISADGGTVQYAARVARPGEQVFPPVATGQNIVIAHTTVLSIVDRQGRTVRDIDLRSPIRSPVTPFRNNLVVGIDSGGGRLAMVDPSRQFVPIIWEITTGLITGAPATTNDLIFAGSALGRVYACDDEKKQVWNLAGGFFQTDRPISADLAADDYGVYAASQDTKLYVLDKLNGRVKWVYHAGVPLVNGPLLTADSVYQPVPGVGLVALTKTGENKYRTPRWTAQGVRQLVSVDERHVYVATDDGAIAALDKQTGAVRFTSEARGFVAFATNLASPTIYAATRDGRIVAIRPVLRPGTIGLLVGLPTAPQLLAAR